MEQQPNGSRTAVIILGIALPVLLAAGMGGTWYVMGQKATKEKDALEQRIATFEKNTSEKPAPTPTATPVAAKEENNQVSPVVAFYSPGTFTEQEKNTIRTKITEPYLAYAKLMGTKLVSLLVKEVPEGNKGPNEYSYSVDAIANTGFAGGWLFGEGGKVDYWKAICGERGTQLAKEFGECPAGMADFKSKYPNNH